MDHHHGDIGAPGHTHFVSPCHNHPRGTTAFLCPLVAWQSMLGMMAYSVIENEQFPRATAVRAFAHQAIIEWRGVGEGKRERRCGHAGP